MKRTGKVSNVHDKVHFKQKQRIILPLLEIHSSIESILVKVQDMSLLIKLRAINMQLYQKWTHLWHHQETVINKNK